MRTAVRIIFLFLCYLFSLSGNSQEEAKEKTVLRVLTYNILHGATTNRDNDLDVVANVINQLKPDIVALQEMDYRTNRVQKRDINTELALKTQMSSIFAKAVDLDGGEYGQSIFYRGSFLETGKIDLPGAPDKEPRIAVTAKIILPAGDTIQFIGTHLDHVVNSPDRLKQATKINALLENVKIPTILAGDLNDVPGSETISIFESAWTSTYDKEDPEPTFPSHAPAKKIDYVMFSPSHRWKVLETKVICHTIASDHCAYLVVLELLPGE
ncbi:Metal-dependent hydrolase, endonuclease/exonuclease/phosphatase family [Salinimicrobium sediminis]|uniref:Metal-dependent hydrolase, endonuclease/exonuclease/phosphatase family n=1 Tax=Salinimicrobium sediminis TaxID=1343891 RepID=A0A285X4P9_9FLAO|nr:endonuclease/exonuclease/phosphatase family protein [Salinimicrobium sediminis]SOC79379.1 Metal-dependent hydrolase, endonuclease/exonuclease/phosphatase family [Salinimicrobium sediminis]